MQYYSALFGLISSLALSALCDLCTMHISPVIQLDHVMIRMCSILGMNTIVTMECYGMCLSLK